jgi:hypothetical protein
MDIETLGHAGLLVRDDAGDPVLFTDPWISGSCYWRSWWLQNYPSEALLEELKRARFCYITHEHPDHFHTASIRLLGAGPHFLCPTLPQEHIAGYLSRQGCAVSVVPPFQWRPLHPDVTILSIPLWNDDSVLLVDTPSAVVINVNDAKPHRQQFRQLRRWLDRARPAKARVLLSSYSPASIVNSFVRDAQRISLKEKTDYVRYIGTNCRLLNADYFMPFASQVIFKRSDSAWANDFKVTFADLERNWSGGRTRLLPPYTRLNLSTGAHTFVPPSRYRHDEEPAARKVQAQQALDRSAEFSDEDVERLRRKLAYCRWMLAILFPRGVAFMLEQTRLHYDPWSGRLSRGEGTGDFALKVPAQAFKDALEYGHFGDLGITMFTMVILNSNIHPRRVYLFFMVMTLHDYGHTATLRNAARWLRNTLTIQRWRIP